MFKKNIIRFLAEWKFTVTEQVPQVRRAFTEELITSIFTELR